MASGNIMKMTRLLLNIETLLYKIFLNIQKVKIKSQEKKL